MSANCAAVIEALMRCIPSAISQLSPQRGWRSCEPSSSFHKRSAYCESNLRNNRLNMTPLAWWVLLVGLLGRTDGVPAQRRHVFDACVDLCRAEGNADFSSGSCDYGELVQQFDDHLQGPRGLLRLCLSPCALGKNLHSRKFVFHPSTLCQRLRTIILKRHNCVCKNSDNPEDLDHPRNSHPWLKNLIDRHSGVLGAKNRPIDRITMAILEKSAVGVVNSQTRNDQRAKIARAKSNTDERFTTFANNDPETAEDEKNLLEGNETGSTAAPTNDETTVAEIDWDLWCMAQCENGQGGSACYCDLIP